MWVIKYNIEALSEENKQILNLKIQRQKKEHGIYAARAASLQIVQTFAVVQRHGLI
jgi:hypothetical protein